MIRIANDEGLFMYRHDPYNQDILANLKSHQCADGANKKICGAIMSLTNERSSSAASVTDSHSDSCSDALSFSPSINMASSSIGAPTILNISPSASSLKLQQQPASSAAIANRIHNQQYLAQQQHQQGVAAANFRFATVAFKFYTAICIAPFRCAPGDVVVVADSVTRNVNIGVVRSVRSEKPDIPVFLELMRHARDFDRSQKNIAMSKEPGMLAAAEAVAAGNFISLPMSFRDVELNLDGSSVTFLVDAPNDSCSQEHHEALGHLHRLLEMHFCCQVTMRYSPATVASSTLINAPLPIESASPAPAPESPAPVL